MPIHLIKCDVCPAQFRVKNLKKPYIGMYRGNSVFHWHYICPVCKHVHTVRFYNKFVNTYFDKVMSLEFSLLLNRKDEEKCKQLVKELQVAKGELEFVTNEMKSHLVPIRKI